MHKFVFEKKKKNLLKYDDSSKLNDYAMPVPKGTVSIMLNTRKKNNGFTINTTNSKLGAKSKFKIKWKTVQWLVSHRRESVKNLMKEYKSIFNKYCKDEDNAFVSKKEFMRILISADLGGDQELMDKIFL